MVDRSDSGSSVFASQDDFGGRIGRVAHELNTPVSLIVGSLDNLERHVEALVRYFRATEARWLDEPGSAESPSRAQLAYAAENAPRLMAVCEEGTRRLRFVLDQLKSYAAPPASDTVAAPVDVDEAVDRAVRAFANRIDASLVAKLGTEGAPSMLIDPGSLDQILGNLVDNAIDAVESVDDPRIWIVVGHDVEAGMVELRVRDNGSGVSPDDRESIFEPFFTTRVRGAGMGLGLAIARELAAAAGGSLELVADASRGTEFLLRVPGAAGVAPSR